MRTHSVEGHDGSRRRKVSWYASCSDYSGHPWQGNDLQGDRECRSKNTIPASTPASVRVRLRSLRCRLLGGTQSETDFTLALGWISTALKSADWPLGSSRATASSSHTNISAERAHSLCELAARNAQSTRWITVRNPPKPAGAVPRSVGKCATSGDPSAAGGSRPCVVRALLRCSDAVIRAAQVWPKGSNTLTV